VALSFARHLTPCLHDPDVFSVEVLLKHFKQRLGGLVAEAVLTLKMLGQFIGVVLVGYLNTHNCVSAYLHIHIK
jgi:hypothetical protein